MISQQLSVNSRRQKRLLILLSLYSCILIFLVDKMNATPTPLNTQNKPIFKTGEIAVSVYEKRTQASGLKSQASANKPKQTHFSKSHISVSVQTRYNLPMTKLPKPDKTIQTDICIIGAGAAGLMAAVTAAENTQASIAVIESNTNPGRKLLITGGGRCNITHDCDARQFLRDCEPYARFLRHAIHSFSPGETCEFFNRLGVETVTEADNCVFPKSDRAVDVLGALLDAIKQHPNVSFYYDKPVKSVTHNPGDNTFTVSTSSKNFSLTAHKLILAAGGASYPKTGSNGSGYHIAAALGHTITKPASCLAPLVCQETWLEPLAGVSLPNVMLSAGTGRKKVKLQGPLLFTNDGIAGPASWNFSRQILPQLHQQPVDIAIDLTPQLDAETLQQQIMDMIAASPKKEIARLLTAFVPHSLAQSLCRQAGAQPSQQAHQLKKEHRKKISAQLKNLPLTALHLRPIEQAIITRGGVKTSEIDPKTMQSTILANLYFAGEIIDTDGPCGGYNLQIAWSTARLAAENAAR